MNSSWYPPPSQPRPVEGGLKARRRRPRRNRADLVVERFIAVLEDIGLGNRLQRGRTYARKGQVISLEVIPGSVTAQVRGSRARPYRIRIGIPAFGKSEWARVGGEWLKMFGTPQNCCPARCPTTSGACSPGSACRCSRHRPGAVAGLLLPPIAPSCKHLAATFYLLAESFDDDPFAILAWRGREREDLLANLAAARTEGPPAADRAPNRPARPLADCVGTYYAWRTGVRVPSPRRQRHRQGHRRRCSTSCPTPASPSADGRSTELLRPAYDALGRGSQAQLP